MSLEIKPGQTVYSRDGEKYHVREVLQNNRLLVSPYLIAQDWEGEEEEYLADTASVKLAAVMSPEAPRAVVDAEVAQARETLADLRAQHAEKVKAIHEADREQKAVAKRIAAAPKLGRLLDYIDGKITHFVCSGYQQAFTIKTWGELAVYQEDRRDKGVKLLTLFGDSKGDTEWRLNMYRDGSGSNTVVIPCTSEEEARQVVGEQLEAVWPGFSPTHPWFMVGAINSARAYGFPVPAEIEVAVARHMDEQHQRSIQKLKDDLAEAEAKYAAIRERRA